MDQHPAHGPSPALRQPPLPAADPPDAPGGAPSRLAAVAAIAWRTRRRLLALALLGCALGAGLTLVLPPRYTARTSLLPPPAMALP